jgi:hypothetical protein
MRIYRRTLKRRLSRQLRRTESAEEAAKIKAALNDDLVLEQIIDSLRSETREIGDGKFIDFLLNVDWEKLFALIIKILGYLG